MIGRSVFLLAFLAVYAFPLTAQVAPTTVITVSGRVIDKTDSTYSPIPMVINRKSGSGRMGKPDGTFTFSLNRTDTLLITSSGYIGVKICFRDSTPSKSSYTIRLLLQPKTTTLRGVAVYPVKTLQEVKQERQSVGLDKFQYQTHGVSGVLESPITALYERFSRRGRSIRYVAEMEAEDKKRDALKDLFRIYIKADIIDLSEDEFEKFILYLNLPDDFIRSASEYDLVTAVKARYEQFREVEKINRRNRY